MFNRMIVALLLVLLALTISQSVASALPPEFEDTLVAEFIRAPMDIAWTPDGRILVPSKGGHLFVIENDVLLPTPAIFLGDIMCDNGERAMGGVAVHPDFESNHYIYLYYTYMKFGTCNESEIDGPVNRLSRFVLEHDNTIDPASEVVLFDTSPLYRDHHNAGDMEFGLDGYLYVTVGDGGTRTLGYPQDPGRLLGKIVRLTDTGDIPPDNPFTGPDSARCNADGVPPAGSPAGTKCQEVFSIGFRNPFRFAFDPNASTTRFYVNDVGQSTWEEISEGPVSGGNYGWSIYEGPCLKDSLTDCDPDANYVDPVHWYQHGPFGAAVTGGAFVPNGVWPAEYDGAYLYADYVFGKIYQLMPGGSGCRLCDPPTSDFVVTDFADIAQLVEMAFGPYGSTQALYYIHRDGDQLRRIVYTGSANRAPIAAATADPVSGTPPLLVQFDGTASSDPDGDPLSYQWDFEGDGTPDSTDPAPSHTYSSAGAFFAELTVDDGQGAQDSTTVRIDVGNNPPTPVIDTPVEGTTFAVGDLLTVSGSATDPEDGLLPDSALTWEVRQHHASHYHPFLDPTSGNNILLQPAPAPEDFLAATNSYIEILLTATDSTGLSSTVTRNIFPKTVDLAFDSDPQGLDLLLDGFSITTPANVISWEAHTLQVEAPDQTGPAGKSWNWLSWSDGGAQSHTVIVPATATSFTAFFEEVASPELTFAATDDATIRETRPTSNYGAEVDLLVDGSSKKDTLLRFDVIGIGAASVANAKIRLYNLNSSPEGGEFLAVTDNSWSEETVTWDTAPPGDGGSLGSLGTVDPGNWYEFDVTPLVTGDGPISLRISSNDSNGADYASKENSNGNGPELVVTLGEPPAPDQEPPSPPGNLVATDIQATEVTIAWDASTDNVGVTGYDIYRDGALLDSVGVATSYLDLTVSPENAFQYAVYARDAADNVSDPSNLLDVTTPAIPVDEAPPSPPGNLTAVDVQPSYVTLSWDASSDDVGVVAYDIYRDGGFLDSVGPVTTYQDMTVAPEVAYQYIVHARDAAGNVSDPSNPADVFTPAQPSIVNLTPTDDASVHESRPNDNFGSDPLLEVDGSSKKDVLLKFDISSAGATPVTSAVLRLYALDGSHVGGEFTAVSDQSWSEDIVTWQTAPPADGGLIASLDRVRKGLWYEVDITGLVNAAIANGDSSISLRVSSTVSNGVDYASKENSSGLAPELVIALQ